MDTYRACNKLKSVGPPLPSKRNKPTFIEANFFSSYYNPGVAVEEGGSEIVCVFRGGRGVNCSFRGMPGMKL